MCLPLDSLFWKLSLYENLSFPLCLPQISLVLSNLNRAPDPLNEHNGF